MYTIRGRVGWEHFSHVSSLNVLQMVTIKHYETCTRVFGSGTRRYFRRYWTSLKIFQKDLFHVCKHTTSLRAKHFEYFKCPDFRDNFFQRAISCQRR